MKKVILTMLLLAFVAAIFAGAFMVFNTVTAYNLDTSSQFAAGGPPGGAGSGAGNQGAGGGTAPGGPPG